MAGGDLRVIVVGLGYFSRFHLDAWAAQSGVVLTALCDTDPARLSTETTARGVPGGADLAALVDSHAPDIVDIVAPPPAHAALIRTALARGRTIICQKPFCTSIAEAEMIMAEAEATGTQIVIHENFRFQPWHRATHAFLQSGRMGEVYQARFALRPGDGRGADAYLDRQPAFQTMPRLLIHETAVHIFDLFRWYLGDIDSVYADLRRLNPAIRGEDAGTVLLTHRSGARSIFDGNRLSDHVTDVPRRTMGEMEIEGEGGCLTLDGRGQLWFRPFGTQSAEPVPLTTPVDDTSFGGGCVAALIAHVVKSIAGGDTPENTARAYAHVMDVTEAAYRSAETGHRITIDTKAA